MIEYPEYYYASFALAAIGGAVPFLLLLLREKRKAKARGDWDRIMRKAKQELLESQSGPLKCRVPESSRERAELNVEFEQTVKEMVKIGIFPVSGLTSVSWRQAPHVDKRVFLRSDGTFRRPKTRKVLLYTEYLEQWPNAPVLLDKFRKKLTDHKETQLMREVHEEISSTLEKSF